MSGDQESFYTPGVFTRARIALKRILVTDYWTGGLLICLGLLLVIVIVLEVI